MNVLLPKGKFTYKDKNGSAKSNGRTLIIHGNVRIYKLMKELTLAIWIRSIGRKCYYCDEQLKKGKETLDHMYPQSLGGPYIPNNLVPCCQMCNEHKGNKTRNQFEDMNTDDPKERRTLSKQFDEENQEIVKNKGFVLPDDWLTEFDITNLPETLFAIDYDDVRTEKVAQFYDENGHYKTPVIISGNGYILSGMQYVCHAKKLGMTHITAIVLKNVLKFPAKH